MKKQSKQNIDAAIIIAFGSNLGGRYSSSRALLEDAVSRLSKRGVDIVEISPWWRSTSWPDATNPDYLNGVALVDTALTPHALLDVVLELERVFGRRRAAANGPRTLDIDLVAYGRLEIHEVRLTVPHPGAADRRFVMGPLAQIAPDWVHPQNGLTATQLFALATVGADAAPIPSSDRREG